MKLEELTAFATKSQQTGETIAARAKEMGMTFPSDVAAFFESFDGVDLDRKKVYIDGAASALDEIRDLARFESYFEGAEHHAEDPSYRYTFRHCVIGSANAEELVLICEEGESYGKVVFWDNEEGCLMEDPEDHVDELDGSIGNEQIAYLLEQEVISELASTFTEFIERLRRDED